MDDEVLQAINIVKGELNGDEFLWDVKHYDESLGRVVQGCWKSKLEKGNHGNV